MYIKYLYLFIVIKVCIACINNNNLSDSYYCEVYYTCKNNEYEMQICDNNKVYFNNECISQDEYKLINGHKCKICPKLSDDIIKGKSKCSKISHGDCCYEYDDKLIYCSYSSYWNNISFISSCNNFIR